MSQSYLKKSVQNFNKIGALVFEKSCPPTSKIQFYEKTGDREGSQWKGISKVSLSQNFTPIDFKLWENILEMYYYNIKNYEKNRFFQSFKSHVTP